MSVQLAGVRAANPVGLWDVGQLARMNNQADLPPDTFVSGGTTKVARSVLPRACTFRENKIGERMRLAALAVALILMPGTRAHADAMFHPDLPELSVQAVSAPSLADELSDAPSPVALPSETGAAAVVLVTPQTTGVTPEPSSVVLMGSGLVCFGGLVWRRRLVSRSIERSAR